MTRDREREVAQVMAEETPRRAHHRGDPRALAPRRPNELSASARADLLAPGPEGSTAAELDEADGTDRRSIEALLDDLEELGYIERDGGDGRLWLTIEGYDLLADAESVLLDKSRAREEARQRAEAREDREAREEEERRASVA